MYMDLREKVKTRPYIRSPKCPSPIEATTIAIFDHRKLGFKEKPVEVFLEDKRMPLGTYEIEFL